jgi:FkbM family methyltransferase
MFKKIYVRVERLFVKIILNYKNHDFWFLSYLNWKISNNYRFSNSGLSKNEPQYKITDIKSNKSIFFGYRKQGLMCYSNGIIDRGNSLANEYLIDDLNFKDGDYIFDIGANTGDLSIFFENKKININYYGFDPGLIEYNSLKLNITQGKTFNFALGNEDCEKTFYYKPEFGDSSLVEMLDYTNKYNVQVKKIETFLEEYNLSNSKIKLIKVEAEGFEPEIIYGIGDSLKNVEYITADLGFERGITQDTTAPQVLEYLILNNFEIVKINKDRFCFLLKNKLYEE